MTRQETVIKITKITRIVGEMKSQLDLDDEIEFEALDSSWMNIGKWGHSCISPWQYNHVIQRLWTL